MRHFYIHVRTEDEVADKDVGKVLVALNSYPALQGIEKTLKANVGVVTQIIEAAPTVGGKAIRVQFKVLNLDEIPAPLESFAKEPETVATKMVEKFVTTDIEKAKRELKIMDDLQWQTTVELIDFYGPTALSNESTLKSLGLTPEQLGLEHSE